VRNLFKYPDITATNLLKALLNMSLDNEYMSILTSNSFDKKQQLPLNYINYDIIAGVGAVDVLQSNTESFESLKNYHNIKKDWFFGYLSYDLKNEVENLKSQNHDAFGVNNLLFFQPEYVLLLKDNQLEIQTFQSKYDCDKFVTAFSFEKLEGEPPSVNFSQRDTKESYIEKIENIKSHIQKGDIYEMNYCQEFYAEQIKLNPELVFADINKEMSTPFSAFLKLEKQYVLSASPERFIKKSGKKIISQPIKGTRKRGGSTTKDSMLIEELRISKKDISENIMITDLVRNDLSITASKASVKVDELCEIYTFEKVHQMISTISSKISEDIHFADVLGTTFPMGSMTGAPKLKAMELIEKFENFKRGIFSGAVGYITPEGDFDFSVVIRTILYNLASQYLSIGVGGAITIKSDSLEEYEECLIKAKPLFEALNFNIDD
jgi:para-aminobenzoate synthetase component 1